MPQNIGHLVDAAALAFEPHAAAMAESVGVRLFALQPGADLSGIILDDFTDGLAGQPSASCGEKIGTLVFAPGGPIGGPASPQFLVRQIEITLLVPFAQNSHDLLLRLVCFNLQQLADPRAGVKESRKDRRRPHVFLGFGFGDQAFGLIFGDMPVDVIVMAVEEADRQRRHRQTGFPRKIQKARQRHQLAVAGRDFIVRRQPPAMFTVLHKEQADAALQQIRQDYEARILQLQGKEAALLQVIDMLSSRPQNIELVLGDKRMITTGRDYHEQTAGDSIISD